MKKTFTVGGMTCSACSAGIEKGVTKLTGVSFVSVSLMAKSMTVEFDENVIAEDEILAFVTKLGYEIGDENLEIKDQAKALRNRFFISLAFLLPLFYLCFGGAVGAPIFYDNRINFSIQLVLALVIIVINGKFYINGFKAVKNLAPNMDTLVSLGSISAFLYSVVMTVLLFTKTLNPHHVFFDGSAMVLALVTLGKWLEEISKVKTGDAIKKLSKMMPKTITVLIDGKEKTILASEAKVGDIVVLKAGEISAVDGVVAQGGASIDKSAITGESMPEEVGVGQSVSSGSIVTNGYILVKAEKVGEETLFSKIIQRVKLAGSSKAPIQKFADKVAGVFVPIVAGIAIITLAVWLAVTGDVYKSFNFALSVLVISCPCALGLATPVAVVAGAGKGAKHGVLYKDAESLQKLCRVNCVLLDKTATLTVGEPKVIDYINLTEENLLKEICALEQKSSHPLAKRIVEFCGESDLAVQEYTYVLGKGIKGVVNNAEYLIGNVDLISASVEIPENLLPHNFVGKTVIYAVKNNRLKSVLTLADYLKPEAIETVKALKANGIKTVMITGDNEYVAQVIASEVGIDEFHANVLPDDKYKFVEKYKAEGYFVAMVGDGINDSPALKGADVGIAIGSGTDVAIDSADVVLVGGINALLKASDISKKTFRIIKENLFWAFIYNLIGIPIAAGALSALGVTLTPIIASICMCLSSICVVLNALRINVERNGNKDKGENVMTIKIKNMMCKHCEAKVNGILTAFDGISNVKINLKKKTATFDAGENFDKEKLFSALKDADFDAE